MRGQAGVERPFGWVKEYHKCGSVSAALVRS